MQEYSKYVDDDTKPHVVFYSVCQAFFHLFIARHKEFGSSRNGECKFILHTYVIGLAMTVLTIQYLFFFSSCFSGILFLQELDIPRIVTCRLNPLKMCNTKIVQNFADITNMYQLAYCYTIIENNERNQLPIFGVKTHLPILVSNCFPFESYTLQHSRQRIVSLFHSNVADADSKKI